MFGRQVVAASFNIGLISSSAIDIKASSSITPSSSIYLIKTWYYSVAIPIDINFNSFLCLPMRAHQMCTSKNTKQIIYINYKNYKKINIRGIIKYY